MFDETGASMVPTYTVKGQNRRYRYYVSRPATKGEASKAALSRIPAPPFEVLLSQTLRRLGLPANQLSEVIERVDVRANELVLHLKRANAMAIWQSNDSAAGRRAERQILSDKQAGLAAGETFVENGERFILSLPVRARFRGGAASVIHMSSMPKCRPDLALIKALARAHQWRNMLLSGEATSIDALAKRFDLDRRHVGLTLNLAFLSPTLTRAIVRGEQPPSLRLSRLHREGIPLSWREQEALFLAHTPNAQ